MGVTCASSTAPYRKRSISSMKIARAALARSASRARRWCRSNGAASTHWRMGTWGRTESTRCAAVCAARREVQLGQKPRSLQEKATSTSDRQARHATRRSLERARRNPDSGERCAPRRRGQCSERGRSHCVRAASGRGPTVPARGAGTCWPATKSLSGTQRPLLPPRSCASPAAMRGQAREAVHGRRARGLHAGAWRRIHAKPEMAWKGDSGGVGPQSSLEMGL